MNKSRIIKKCIEIIRQSNKYKERDGNIMEDKERNGTKKDRMRKSMKLKKWIERIMQKEEVKEKRMKEMVVRSKTRKRENGRGLAAYLVTI